MTTSLSQVLLELSRRYAAALERSMGERLISVVLYGSVARGEATPLSDIDLLVIGDGLPRGQPARRALLEKADQAVNPELETLRAQNMTVDFCVLVLSREQAQIFRPLYLDFIEDAVILYDRNAFFSGILDRLRRRLQQLGARRLRLGKVRYWDLKPDMQPGEIFEIKL